MDAALKKLIISIICRNVRSKAEMYILPKGSARVLIWQKLLFPNPKSNYNLRVLIARHVLQ